MHAQVVARVVLHHRTAFELSLFGEVANRAHVFSHSVVRQAEHDCRGEEGLFVSLARGALAEDGVVVLWAVDVVVAREEEGGQVLGFGDQQLAGLGAAGGQAEWEVGHAGDVVEDGVFGCFPVVGPGDEAGGFEGFGCKDLERVAHGEAVAVEVEDRFEGGEEDGERFELEMRHVDRVLR